MARDRTAQIATVTASPSAETSSRLIYMTRTPRILINGTNFNVNDTKLFFDPPLQEGVTIQKQVRAGS